MHLFTSSIPLFFSRYIYIYTVFHIALLEYIYIISDICIIYVYIRLLIDGCLITGRRGKAMKMMIMSLRNPNMKRYVLQR